MLLCFHFNSNVLAMISFHSILRCQFSSLSGYVCLKHMLARIGQGNNREIALNKWVDNKQQDEVGGWLGLAKTQWRLLGCFTQRAARAALENRTRTSPPPHTHTHIFPTFPHRPCECAPLRFSADKEGCSRSEWVGEFVSRSVGWAFDAPIVAAPFCAFLFSLY